MTQAAGLVLAATSLILLSFGLNLLYLSRRAFRTFTEDPPMVVPGQEQLVCVQLPIYNERHVAERVIDAACSLDWPRERIEIQVLDDSDDDTRAIVAGAVRRWAAAGITITQLGRPDRGGYKAGALAHGMTRSAAPFFAVFDADFVPPPDFLRRSMAAFEDGAVGFVQARWGHLNEGYSWFTRMQALAIDFHFLIEQSVRSQGFFTNFTGTAGVWRRAAIEAAGGWSAETLTEDLDLSYRAQLRGWRPRYLERLVVPEELPVEVESYRRQQARWATGSFQAARRLIGPVLRGPFPVGVKWQACVHLLSYGVGPLMLLQLACYPLLVAAQVRHEPSLGLGGFGLAVNAISVAPWAGFIAAQVRRGRPWWRGLPAGICQVLGAGLSLTVLIALVRSLRPGGEFVRTPKYRIVEAGEEWRDSAYVRVGSPAAILELGLGLGAAVLALIALTVQMWLVAVYSALFATGLLSLSLLSLAEALQVITFRRLGARALHRVRIAGPLCGLLLLPGLLLGVVALLGDPFEDGYQHWLMAATLAETGRLRDPLFGMQDTWLPGYQLLAAGLLKVLGLWNLGALKAANATLGLGTLVLVSRLAPDRRQARLAVLLLGLNPIFLLTATSAVAEPLLLFLLMAATLAAVRGRVPLAGLLFAAACLTGTKAWIWLLLLAAIQLLGELHLAAPGRSRRLVWLSPALGMLIFLQLGFGPATHSIARAGVEVSSAAVRGSVLPSPLARAGGFAAWFAVASLPLLVLAPIGLIVGRRLGSGGWDRLRLLHLPSLGYLAAVTVLVAAGAYTGSHRYYYLALPSLALLAAAALAGRRLGSLLAVATAGLITLAYLPVFASFAAANTGLAAAGAAAGATPGRLLTDSPVAAFASRKYPAQISGSAALPRQPGAALGWLRQGGYTALVVESIDYYRASSVFPQLARGEALAPFHPVAPAGAFQAAGGKAVHVYRLDGALFDADLGAGLVACIHPDLAPAVGKTAALQKGVILERSGLQIAGEGVGFGVPIAHFADGWFLPGTATLVEVPDPTAVVWVKVFDLDRREADDAAGRFLRFETVPSRGRVQVTYRIEGPRISVAVEALTDLAGSDQVVLLNEQGGSFDDFASPSQQLIGPGFGSWVAVEGDWARLRSGSAGAEWSLPRLDGAGLHAAHESVAPNIDFAGLEYGFGAGFKSATYVITTGGAR